MAHFRYLPSPLYPIHVHISLINLFEHPGQSVLFKWEGGGKEDRRLVRRRLYKFTEEEELRLRARVAQGVKFFLFQEVSVGISLFLYFIFFFNRLYINRVTRHL